MLRRMLTLMGSQRGQRTSLDPISNVRPHPSRGWLLTKPSLLIGLCVAAAQDVVKAGVILPRRVVETSSNDTPAIIPSAIDGGDGLGESLTTVDPVY